MTDLERRKKLLIAENEVCREVLRLQIHNLRAYGIRARQRFTMFSARNPLLFMALPMAGSLFARKRRFTLKRLSALAFVGWQLYRRFRMLPAAYSRSRPRAGRTAAEEYLEKRI